MTLMEIVDIILQQKHVITLVTVQHHVNVHIRQIQPVLSQMHLVNPEDVNRTSVS